MSNALVLAFIAVGISLVAVLIAVRSRGPRVTQIHTRRDDKSDDETGAD